MDKADKALTEASRTAARTAVSQCLDVQSGERVLIVSNFDGEVAAISRALYDACLDLGAKPALMFQETKAQTDFAEDAVIGAIGTKPEVFISMSAEKLGKDRAALEKPYKAPDGRTYDHLFHYLLHGTKEMRAFWSPSTNVDMFARTVPVDYALMKARARALSRVLDGSVSVRVTAPGGTDVVLGLRGRKTMADDGDFSKPGSGGNLPAGEVFLSPELHTMNGLVVYDGSISDTVGDIVIHEPIRCTISGGFVMSVEGGEEARKLEAALQRGLELAARFGREGRFDPETALRYGTNARHIGELGIGLNPKAEIRGNMLEDEKVLGACHFAIGSNYDEDAPAMIHLDGLVRNPTILARTESGTEVVLMKDGILSLD